MIVYWRGNELKGQSSVEFLLVVAVILLVLTTFTVTQMFNPSQNATQEVTSASLANSVADRIANAINGVSSGGEGTVDSVGVSLTDKWSLRVERDNQVLKIGVKTGKSVTWLESELIYAFNAELVDIPSGEYIVIVEKGGDEGISRSNNRIFINVNPSSGGGRWKY